MINPREVIAMYMGGLVGTNPPPRPMHKDLAPWHVTFEQGHNVVAVADPGDLGEDPPLERLAGLLLPAPVKTVERVGWRVVKGFIVAPLPVDPELGLVVPQEDEEHIQAAAEKTVVTRLEVGARYPTRLPWQDGAAEISITAQGVDFALPLSSPSASEVHAFGKGNAEFALVLSDRFALWLFRFSNPKRSGNPAASGPGIAWSDAPWQYHRQALGSQAPAPPGTEGQTFLFQLILVDADTGVIKALRTITPPVPFAENVRTSVARQVKHLDTGLRTADAEIADLYARYPMSADLLPLAEARFEALRDGTK